MRRPRKATLVSVSLVALLAMIGSVAATRFVGGRAKSDSNAQLTPAQQELIKTQRELRQISDKLRSIQKATLASDRALAARSAKISSMVETSMKRQGQDAKKGVERLEQLQQQLKSGKLDKARRKKTMAELRSRAMALQHAQFKAMRSAEVRKATKAFQTDLEAAMIKKDPATKKHLERLKQLTAKLRTLIKKSRIRSHRGAAVPARDRGPA